MKCVICGKEKEKEIKVKKGTTGGVVCCTECLVTFFEIKK